MTVAYPNEVFSAFAFLGFLMCCIPFPWHLEAWNTGTCLYMFWTGLACLNQFVNSIVWKGSVLNVAPVWCDISSRIIVGSAVAIPAASLCINRRLYHISTVRSVTVTKAEKRRAVMVDIAIGVGLPVMQMILQYIPQGHRFDIWEDIGCFPFTYNTYVALIFVSVPPILIGLVSGVYGVLSIRSFLKLRSQFKEVLTANSNLSTSRYFRLMLLSGIEVICTVPLGIYALCLNASHLKPWLGWEDTHLEFSKVLQYPGAIWRGISPVDSSLELTRWFPVVCAIVFFALFGFAEEARKNYRSAAQSVGKHVGVSSSFSSGAFTSTGSKSSSSSSQINVSGGVLPVFVKRDVLRKHDSLDTLSDMSASFADASGYLNEKAEKEPQAVQLEMTYNGLVIPDVAGTLADYNAGPYSPAPSSGPSSVSSVTSLPDTAHPSPATARPESSVIEVSSLRYSRAVDDSLTAPERALRKNSFDGPSPV